MTREDDENANTVVVGVDGGGTTTDVIVADTDGRVLSSADGGGANPQHNPLAEARVAVQETIERALERADRTSEDVAALTAGLAGFNDESDRAWATSFTAVPGLECTPTCVNDAVVAHTGALLGEPGIVPICGTGSIVFGITEAGRELRNYDVDHYACAGARHLGQRVLEVLVDRDVSDGLETDVDLAFEYDRPLDSADRSLVDRVLSRWGFDTLEACRTDVDDAFVSTYRSGNALDSIAPVITDEAMAGSPLARAVCDDAVAAVVEGIRTVGTRFDDRTGPIPVAPTGSVLRSQYVQSRIRDVLECEDHYRIVEPTLNPVSGAVLESLRRLEGAESASDLANAIDQLGAHPTCRVS